MNVMDKNFKNGMTLDSRTFEKCSNAMLMHFSSTLPTRDELIHTPLGQFEIRSKPVQNEANKQETHIIPSVPLITGPTPTPPPRKKKMSAVQDKTKVIQEREENLDGKDSENAKSSEDDNIPRHASSFSEQNKRRRRGDAVFSRPVQFIMDWMTNIANEMELSSCPPV